MDDLNLIPILHEEDKVRESYSCLKMIVQAHIHIGFFAKIARSEMTFLLILYFPDYTRNQVPLYLWRIKPKLKCCIISLCYFRDCRRG